MSSFDYRWMLALYLWPPAKLLSCLSFSNLLLRFMKGTQTHNIQAHVYRKNRKCAGIRTVHENTRRCVLSCLSFARYFSLHLISCCVSKRSHERRNFHTFHLLLSSLPLTHSALSLLIALVPSARLIDQKGSECSSMFA